MIDDKSYRGFGTFNGLGVSSSGLTANLETNTSFNRAVDYIRNRYEKKTGVSAFSVVDTGDRLTDFIVNSYYDDVDADRNRDLDGDMTYLYLKYFTGEIKTPDEFVDALRDVVYRFTRDVVLDPEADLANHGVPDDIARLKRFLDLKKVNEDNRRFTTLVVEGNQFPARRAFNLAWLRLRLDQEKKLDPTGKGVYEGLNPPLRADDINTIREQLPPEHAVEYAFQTTLGALRPISTPQITYSDARVGVDVSQQVFISDVSGGNAISVHGDLSVLSRRFARQIHAIRDNVDKGNVGKVAHDETASPVPDVDSPEPLLNQALDTFVKSSVAPHIGVYSTSAWLSTGITTNNAGVGASWLRPIRGGSGVFPLVSSEYVRVRSGPLEQNAVRTSVGLGWQDRVPKVVEVAKETNEYGTEHLIQLARWKRQIGMQYMFKTRLDPEGTSGTASLFFRFRKEPPQATYKSLRSVYSHFVEYGISLGYMPGKSVEHSGFIGTRVAVAI